MDEKNVVDVSSFMLFEATGDSEADSELNMASVDASYGRDVEPDYGDHDEDDDDAESCSYNRLESKPIFELRDPRDHNGDNNDDDDDEKSTDDQDWANVDDDRGNSHDGQEHHHVDGGEDDDDDDEVVMKSTAKTRQHKKPRLCTDSTMGLMNEMEKNRLFWEACLAS